MPTKVITKTVCVRCGKESCDGGYWEMVKVMGTPVIMKDFNFGTMGNERFPSPDLTRKFTIETDFTKFPMENRFTCTLKGCKKELKGKKVGDAVTVEYMNWVDPSQVTWRKIED